MTDLVGLLQWPAMAVTLIAAWLVASLHKRKRSWGFWCFIASNVLWVIWGWHAHAYALIVLQVGLFVLNLRGARKNEPEASKDRGLKTSRLARRHQPDSEARHRPCAHPD